MIYVDGKIVLLDTYGLPLDPRLDHCVHHFDVGSSIDSEFMLELGGQHDIVLVSHNS